MLLLDWNKNTPARKIIQAINIKPFSQFVLSPPHSGGEWRILWSKILLRPQPHLSAPTQTYCRTLQRIPSCMRAHHLLSSHCSRLFISSSSLSELRRILIRNPNHLPYWLLIDYILTWHILWACSIDQSFADISGCHVIKRNMKRVKQVQKFQVWTPPCFRTSQRL